MKKLKKYSYSYDKEYSEECNKGNILEFHLLLAALPRNRLDPQFKDFQNLYHILCIISFCYDRCSPKEPKMNLFIALVFEMSRLLISSCPSPLLWLHMAMAT